MARDDNMIAALKRERALYVSRGLDDRVAQVDEQLAHYGHTPPAAPEGRTPPSSQQQTANASTPADLQTKPPAKKAAATAKKAAAPAKDKADDPAAQQE